MSKLRAGIIGLGGAGTTHASTLQRYFSGDIYLVAVCDRDPNSLERVREVRKKNEEWSRGHSRDISFGEKPPHFYQDWASMLKEEQLDLVIVATLSNTHAQAVVDAANAGVKYIFCEKPIANSVADAYRMVETCEKSGVHLAIDHERRFLPEYRQMRELIRQGNIGDLSSISISCGGARVHDIMVHFVDFARFLTGTDIKRVWGFVDSLTEPNPRSATADYELHDPPGYGVFEFADGVKTTISVRENVALPPSFFIEGTRGRIYVCEDHVGGTWIGERRPETGHLYGTLNYYGSMIPIDGFPTAISEEHGTSEFLIAVGLRDLLAGAPSCSGRDGLAAYEATVAVRMSDTYGHSTVDLPLGPKDAHKIWPHA